MEEKHPSPRVLQTGKAGEQSNCVLFTYFQGDINSVVDEHFSRALNKANKPKDLSTKSKSSRTVQKIDEPSVPVQWNLPPPSWSETAFPATPSRIQFAAAEDHHSVPGVLSSPPGQLPTLWPFPSRHGGGFGLPPIVYPPSVSPEAPVGVAERQYTNSFLNLLHSERPSGSTGLSSVPKPDLNPGWSSTPPADFRDVGRGISLDSGIPAPEKKKDLYWY
ncbi:transcription cofactor vestigial-like protein 1 isoform X2 [Amia ocellicauda]|uniref:transcription cofactor vestigial-like protein 1 isoform X2 n=1 Tax=Amia ocellicauda TaxID=2972642 RepID=UPI003463C0DB